MDACAAPNIVLVAPGHSIGTQGTSGSGVAVPGELMKVNLSTCCPPGDPAAAGRFPLPLLSSLLLLFILIIIGGSPATALSARAAATSAVATIHVSTTLNGAPSPAFSANPAISFDGRYVAFETSASLVSGDSNGKTDVFVYDTQNLAMERVSLAHDGQQANAASNEPSISANGRYVIFTSKASNLIPRPNAPVSARANREPGINVYRRDRQTGNTIAVSVDSAGRPADRHAWMGDLSADGGYVSFTSHSENLVKPDMNGIKRDPFIHDVNSGVTEFADRLPNGTNPWSGGAISAVSEGGRRVAYRSKAPNLVPGDNNARFDIFVLDRDENETRRVSVTSSGAQGNADSNYPDISADGRTVVFETASALVPADNNGSVDIYAHDLATRMTQLVSRSSTGQIGNSHSFRPSVSADGRYVSYSSLATNLVPGDTNGQEDAFVNDLQTGQTIRVSLSDTGAQSTGGYSRRAVISGDGRAVAFLSTARNLVNGVNTGVPQVYVRWLSGTAGETYTISGTIQSEASEPVAGVVVALDSGQTATTDDHGRYTLTNVPPGDYALLPLKENYSFQPESRQVSVPPDRSDEDFTATALPTFTIAGVVRKADSTPLAGVIVSDSAGHSAATDASGRYQLTGLPEGVHTLTAAKTGYTFDPASREIAVPPDAESADFTGRVLTTTYSITGTVKRPDGSGVQSAVVSDGQGRTTSTNFKGVYTLANLPPGTYTLTVSKNNMSFSPASRVVTVPPNATRQNFTSQ